MASRSYALVPFHRVDGGLEVLIGHMGGPFWARKDEGAWSFPKGLPEPGDADGLATARREFAEELGIEAPSEGFVELGDVKQSGGKVVTAWAVETDLDVARFLPGTFQLEWPPRSGRMQEFPEVDRIAWVPIEEAERLLVKAQTAFLDRLSDLPER